MSNIAWAKSQQKPETGETFFLDLPDHSVDVAAVAERLMTATTLRRRLAALAQRPLTGTDFARMGFFAGLHDAGKVNRGFQAKLRKEKPDAGHIGDTVRTLAAMLSGGGANDLRAVCRQGRRLPEASRHATHRYFFQGAGCGSGGACAGVAAILILAHGAAAGRLRSFPMGNVHRQNENRR